ncbi:hypothetical protein GE061_005624 [Apolygus lucorum]|uniref:FP protein C-terminal domain-containing protein n=1 Tax=Apolygus lucorum TaxID=248454 RepID=A0A8S9WWT0_APOLU|nr:hypothetical protein GE061_005624 [Apolygus lucorum]
MNSMETRWVKGGGRKGGNVIFRSEGNSGRFFKFVYHKDLAESVLRWTCAQRTSEKCGAFLKTLGEQVIFASEVHTHEPPNDFDVVELRTSVKRKACEDISTAPRKVIRRALMENPDMSPNVRDVINLRVDCGEIQTAFRVGVQRRDRPRKILALFESSEAADALIKAAKTDKNITANQLYKGWPNDRVYINENLTSYRADLLRRAKVKAKENGYKYVWLKNFIVHVRKDDGERVLTIKTIADLERM